MTCLQSFKIVVCSQGRKEAWSAMSLATGLAGHQVLICCLLHEHLHPCEHPSVSSAGSELAGCCGEPVGCAGSAGCGLHLAR